jgi:hypothetical protein
MKFYSLLAGGLLLGAGTATAQNFQDAMRFSQLTSQGTARSMAIGGAVGAVGADFSALSVNPAGIGLYRRGEFTFSPSIRANSVSGTYNPNNISGFQGGSTPENSGAFSISNIGYVSVSGGANNTNDFNRRQKSSGWVSRGFAIGLNRVADFNRSYTYKGRNDSSSVSEVFVIDARANANANGEIPTDSRGYLGYDAFLIDFDSVGGYYTNADYRLGAFNQQRTVRERGGISEMVLTYGGNYNERFMVGGTLGIPILRYNRTSTFTETDADNAMPQFNRSEYNEELSINGVGVNLKVGVIYKPSDLFRVGLAVHSPTWMSVNDRIDESLTNDVVGYQSTEGPRKSTRPANEFSYMIRTAWRTVLSATAFAGKWGFFSADYEYVGYKSAHFNLETDQNQAAFGTGAFTEAQRIKNDELRANVNNASNFRIGGEGHVDNFYFRAGLGFYGSPYKNTFFSKSRTDYAAGIGVRGQKGFIDVALVQSQFETGETPYTLNYPSVLIAPQANLKNSLTNVTLTFGLKF